jgi:hypothetical protein
MTSGRVATMKAPTLESDHGLEMGGLPPTAPPVTLLWPRLKLRAKTRALLVRIRLTVPRQAKGCWLAPAEAAADVILLNTCRVRDLAGRKALRKMENLVAETRRRPNLVLGLMGCLAQSQRRDRS